MKRILILADINSAHTQKWSISLAQAGFDIGIFTLSFPDNQWYENFENISVFCPFRFSKQTFHSSSLSKIKYLKAVPGLKKIIQKFNPDILHAHYATSYGLIGALTDFHPYLISAWGSDLMDFPQKNIINSKLIKYIFNKAGRILATSKTLAIYAEKFSSKHIDIIPFGVDTNKFGPMKVNNLFETGCIVIGAVKSMEAIYGIDILIKAFAELNLKMPENNLKLLLVGSGSKEMEYRQLVKDFQLEEKAFFTGRIPHNELPKYYNMMDIFVNISYNESFGVSVLEASACEKPVIATAVGGLNEVVVENVTGCFVKPGDISASADAIEKFILNPELRYQYGKEGRKMVEQKYSWNENVREQIQIYNSLIL